jgi:thioredoxin-related protein
MATYINQHFIPVKVVDRMREDHGNPPEVEKLQSRFGVTAFPTVIVVQREREPRKVLGYPGREQFVQFLRGIR